MNKFHFYKQLDAMDCGPTCLRMIAHYYGRLYPLQRLRELTNITREGVSVLGITEAAEVIGMHTLAVNITYDMLSQDVPLPVVVYWEQRHFVVVFKIKKNVIFVADPACGIIKYSKEKFIEGWLYGKKTSNDMEGIVVLFEPTPKFYEQDNEAHKTNTGLLFLLPYLRPYSKLIIQLILGLLVGSILQIVFPFLTQAIVDYGIVSQNMNFVFIVLIAQLMLFASQTAIGIIRAWLLLHIGSRINLSILSNFLSKLLLLPISFFDSKDTGDIMQRISDNRRIENFLSFSTLNAIFSTFNILVFSLILAYYSLSIFAVFLASTLLYIAWVQIFMKKRAQLDYKRFAMASHNQSSTIQLINGMQEIKLNNSEKKRRWEWEEIQIKLFKVSTKSLGLAQMQSTGAGFLNELKNILITFMAANSVVKGEISLGMMLAIQYIIGQLNAPIDSFINFFQSAQDAQMSIERLSEILDKPNEDNIELMGAQVLPTEKTIKICDLFFRYGGKNSAYVLKNINITIPAGKVTAIVGASGSGKTTLIKLLLKFYELTQGKIIVGGMALSGLNAKMWRQKCGVVMQDGFIFSDTIFKNITESSQENVDDLRLQAAVKMANINEFIEKLPLGYATRIGTGGIAISGGQRQRLLIARAIYKNPDFLFFDEATSALDANNERIIVENLARFYEGKTVVVIAHRLSTVQNADQIIVLHNGEVAEQGTHKNLVAAKGYYFTLVKNQLALGD